MRSDSHANSSCPNGHTNVHVYSDNSPCPNGHTNVHVYSDNSSCPNGHTNVHVYSDDGSYRDSDANANGPCCDRYADADAYRATPERYHNIPDDWEARGLGALACH